MHCFAVSRTTCSGICSWSRTRRRAFWRAPGNVTTFQHLYHASTGCQWSNGSSSNWPLLFSSRCVTKSNRTSRTTASLSLDSSHRCLHSAEVNALTVPRSNTRLKDRSFFVVGPKVWNSLPLQHCACCLWPWLVLFQQGDESQGKGQFWGFFFTDLVC